MKRLFLLCLAPVVLGLTACSHDDGGGKPEAKPEAVTVVAPFQFNPVEPAEEVPTVDYDTLKGWREAWNMRAKLVEQAKANGLDKGYCVPLTQDGWALVVATPSEGEEGALYLGVESEADGIFECPKEEARVAINLSTRVVSGKNDAEVAALKESSADEELVTQ